MDSIAVRSFVSSDMPALYRLYREVYETTDSMSECFEEKYPDLPTFLDYMGHLQTIPGHITLLVESAGTLAGYLTIFPRAASKLKHTSDLNMGVAEYGRGKGLGNLLLDTAISLAKKDGVLEIIYLMVRSDNEPAIKLYMKRGFQKLAVLPDDVKIENRYFDGILMRLPIN